MPEDDHGKAKVPVWDGSEGEFERWKEEVKWYRWGTKKEQWPLLAPRLIRNLSGPPRTAVATADDQA